MDDIDPFPDIWLYTNLESGNGIDQSAESAGRLGLFVRGIEVSVLSLFPKLQLPALLHLKLILALAILPNEMTSSRGPLDFGGLRSVLVKGSFISRQSINLLDMMATWMFNRELNEQKHEMEYYKYQQFKSIFLPVDESKTGRLRQNQRVNYFLPSSSPVKSSRRLKREHEDEEDDDLRLYSATKSSRRKSSLIKAEKNDDTTRENTSGQHRLIKPLDYMNKSTFSDVKHIWDIIGWAFTCSTIDDSRYKRRWLEWERFLTFLFNLLEKDYQYEEQHTVKDKFRNDPILCQWVEPVQLEMILEAIFASVEQKGRLKFSPIFPYEIPEQADEDEVQTLSSTGEIILKPIEYNKRSIELRSKLLRLVLKVEGNNDKIYEDLLMTSQTFMGNSWTYSSLLGSLFNYKTNTIEHQLIDNPANCVPSSFIMRIGWSKGLPDSMLTKSWYEYIYEDDNLIEKDTLLMLLKCSPGKTIVTDEFDTVWGIYCLILNSLGIFNDFKDDRAKQTLKTESLRALKEGHTSRVSWFQERYDKGHLKCENEVIDKAIIKRFLHSLADVNTSITSIIKHV